MDQHIPRGEWVAGLKRFTDRNAGRRTVLEEDAPDLGAQSEERNYPLRGVAFDPRDDRVAIMLGELASVDRHLTHSIGRPLTIDLLQDSLGRDAALRITHGGDGQTVLRLLYES